MLTDVKLTANLLVALARDIIETSLQLNHNGKRLASEQAPKWGLRQKEGMVKQENPRNSLPQKMPENKTKKRLAYIGI